MTLRLRLARRLRFLADRIDHRSAPRCTGYSFTFEDGYGIRFRDDGRGCPIWHLGEEAYERAHDEADSARSLDDAHVSVHPRLGHGTVSTPASDRHSNPAKA